VQDFVGDISQQWLTELATADERSTVAQIRVLFNSHVYDFFFFFY
jgi:hypothetical protein